MQILIIILDGLANFFRCHKEFFIPATLPPVNSPRPRYQVILRHQDMLSVNPCHHPGIMGHHLFIFLTLFRCQLTVKVRMQQSHALIIHTKPFLSDRENLPFGHFLFPEDLHILVKALRLLILAMLRKGHLTHLYA